MWARLCMCVSIYTCASDVVRATPFSFHSLRAQNSNAYDEASQKSTADLTAFVQNLLMQMVRARARVSSTHSVRVYVCIFASVLACSFVSSLLSFFLLHAH